uniref:Reverse transcriptase domain-containing protein n=1 Tax=Tanacetum cinerariifolium TaxID=118510 RepID=A0A6L2LMA4_TANCI|nr:reverse transcriptase domain-containing protein [Tanacetum cinerariifolium]GEU62798.1 reverse transcriptase domain-containing protein [Tanacetum cinerariifolium]
MMASFFKMNTASTSGSGPLPSNTIANPNGELKAITTRSGLILDRPFVSMPPPFINPEEDERVEETLMDPDLAEYTIKVPPPLIQKAKPPSQRNYVKMLKALISNKEKLLELANTPLNENCSAVILKKLPKKLGDPRKFLILCGFSELKCKALANLVRSPSPYNGIIGRLGVRKIQAVPSTTHEMLNFLKRPSDVIQSAEERIKVAIHPEHPEQTIVICFTLTEEGQKALCDLLRRNLDLFAWKPADMTGVPQHIAKHRLNMRERCAPVRPKKKSHASERNKAIQDEVEKLVDTSIMKEVHYHCWLSNPVMVKKHDDS